MIDIENIKRLKNISVEDDYLFPTIADTMNACFGKSWKGCQKSFIVLNDGSEVAWFPKIAKWRNNQFVPYDSKQGWLNIVSDDGTQIIEEHPNDPRPLILPDRDKLPRYVFGRYEDNPYRGGRIHYGEKSGFRFLGLFKIVYSEPGHHEYRQIADKVSLLHYYKAIF